MQVTVSKKWLIRIIILFVAIFCLNVTAFSQGPTITSVSVNSCIGEISISASADVSVLPLTYEWFDSDGNLVEYDETTLENAPPGVYTVVVTDKNGDSASSTNTITDPPDLVGLVTVNDVTCKGDSNAQVIIDMANGKAGFNWQLYTTGGSAVSSGSVTGTRITINGLGVNDYELRVEDTYTCTGTIYFSVTEPADYLGSSLVSSTDATCSDTASGSLEVTGTGGWGDYAYQWYTFPGGTYIGNTAAITNLLPGDYRVYITDKNGCVVSPIFTVDSPTPISISRKLEDVSCNGGNDGSIELTVTGGTGGYSYDWGAYGTSSDLTGLSAGTYNVTITDAAGCTATASYTVDEPNALSISSTITDVDCFGDNSGSVNISVSGGKKPYKYSWSSGEKTQDLNGVVAGTYMVTVTDKNGCTQTGTYTINQPSAISIQSSTNISPTCYGGNDGIISVVMQGGTAPYTYSWAGSGSNSSTASGLSAGTYILTVKDDKNCDFTQSFTVTDPPKIAVTTVSSTEPSCNGMADGSLTVSASNGTAPYTYDWDTGASGPTLSNVPAGVYKVTVTDNLGCVVEEFISLSEPTLIVSNAVVNDISCNGEIDGSISLAPTGGTGGYTYVWDHGPTTKDISGLTAGSYGVKIKDGSGCEVYTSFTITEPDPLQVTINSQDVFCKGQSTGSIHLTPFDGTAPYTFIWSDNPGITSEDRINIPAGSYTVRITDASNCWIKRTIVIDEPATVLELSGISTDVTCNGSANGSIDLSVTGGDGPYTYEWNTGDINDDLINIGPGVYTVKVTDANGCEKFKSFTITEPAALSVNASGTDITCNGENDGSISLSVSGGTSPYTYSWNDGSTDSDRTNLSAGNYTVTVTDANGCPNVQFVTIKEPDVLSTTYVTSDVKCFGESTGVINITVSGGNAPYSFLWSNGETSEDLNNVPAGTYTVDITDSKSCTDSKTITITEPASALSFTPSVGQITCNGEADGAISLNVSGGVSPYTYSWSNGKNTKDLSGLAPGTYSVTIRDANLCAVTGSYTITDPPVLSVSGIDTDITCFGADNGSVDLTVTGGEGPYTFTWTTGDNTEDVSGLAPGTHTVTVQDSRGCVKTASFEITQPSALNIAYTTVDVKCFGGNDGSIAVSVTGGTAPYTYSWSNGEVIDDISDLTAQTYRITVTDAKGCSEFQDIIVNQPSAPLSAVDVVKDLSCYGSNDGSVQLTVSGGTAPYTYVWSNGKNTRDIFGLVPGTYVVTIKDANDCTITDSYTIDMPDPLVLSGTKTDLNCNGALSGKIDLTVTGGTAPYSYSWNNGETTQDLENISGGTYEVYVTDSRGCTQNKTFTVVEPLAIVAAVSKSDVTCFGESDGAINISVSGGVAPYTYSWDNGAITKNLPNISGGTYILTITDANGCTKVVTEVVDEPTAPLSASGVPTDVSCFGGNDGKIELTVTGGTAPYTYKWNQGSNFKDVTGLTAGNYQVEVKDSRGCIDVVSFTIGSPTQIQVTATVTGITCNGDNNGAINLAVSGGTGSYTYLWSNGETTKDISGLTPGNYSVQIWDDNSCSISSGTYQVKEPAAIVLSVSKIDVTCFGGNNGSIDLTITGGVGGYTYSWSNGESTQDLSSLSPGTYSVEVSDVNGCKGTTSVTITEPSAALSATAITDDATVYGASDGSIGVTVSGGTSPYTYSWGDGSTDEDRTGLPAGTYEVLITDANGCTAAGSYTVSQPDELVLTGAASDLSCNGARDGSIEITVTGGTTAYTYLWSDGSTLEDRSGLAAGTYSVEVTDAHGDKKTDTFTVTEPDVLSVAYVHEDVKCYGEAVGKITLTVTGGTAPYSYLWNDGSTDANRENLLAGSYSVTVTDKNGCSFPETITINQPSAVLSVTGVPTDLSCYNAGDGSITLAVTGGTAPYTYLWNDGTTNANRTSLSAGIYSVTVTDNNGCTFPETFTVAQPDELKITGIVTDVSCNGNADGKVDITVTGGTGPYSFSWTGGSATEDLENATAGSYTVTVTDQNGCPVSDTFTVTEPDVLSVAYVHEDVKCYGEAVGKITLTVTGGTAPYSYLWNDGSTDANRENLLAGTYSVTVTDKNGCSFPETVTITEPSAALSVTGVPTDLSCYNAGDGSITLTVTGGTAPYTYLWNDGTTDANRTSLSAGTYSVTVTDKNGCTFPETFTVAQPDELKITGIVTDVSCNGNADGKVDITVTGGTGPYTFSWTGGSASEDLENATAGSYTVTVTDQNGCPVSDTFTVTEPDVLSVAYVHEDVKCYGEAVGKITLTVTGGTAPYSYLWNDGSTDANRENLLAGTYSVTVTDKNGCSFPETITINQPSAVLSVTGVPTDLSCYNAGDGSITLTVTGGTAPYTYLWNDGTTDANRTSLSAGTYSVTVTDTNGCTFPETFTVAQPDLLEATYTVDDVTCNGSADGRIEVNVIGGTAPYSYLWSDGGTGAIRTGLSGGSYRVTITDSKNCPIVKDITVVEPLAISVTLTKTDVTCYGSSDGKINIAATGGTAPLSYKWAHGPTTKDLANLSGGTYTLTITDANGCTEPVVVTIDEPSSALAATGTVTDVSCFGGTDGKVELTVTGGTAPYIYQWNNGLNVEDATGLSAGNYQVIVTDQRGCKIILPFTVGSPAQVEVSGAIGNVTCNGAANGSVALTVTGGTGSYTYLWSNGETTRDIKDLGPGTYRVEIRDGNGCLTTASYEVTEPIALSLSYTKADVKCYGDATGEIGITVTGGVGGYTYSWTGDTTSTSRNLSNLGAGTYTVTATDVNSCSVSQTITITEPSAALSVTGVPTDLSCYNAGDGSITLTVTGGTAPYTYLWNDGTTDANRTSLSAGTYSVSVTDKNGCTFPETFTVAQPDELKITGIVTDVSCNSNADGKVDITVTGGTGPYTFSWTGGSASEDLENATAGSYTVTVTDQNGCPVSDTFTVTEPDVLSVAYVHEDVKCYGEAVGKITLTVTGGTAPYSYLWNDGSTDTNRENLLAGTYSVTVTDKNGCSFPETITINQPSAALSATAITDDATVYGASDGSIGVTVSGGTSPYTFKWSNGKITEDISNLQAGIYEVTVTDANGCSIDLQYTISQPDALVLSSIKTNLTCYGANNGSIDITVTGGTGPYAYLWSDGSTLEDRSGLPAGSYSLKVTDAHGDEKSDNWVITEPDLLSVSYIQTDVKCFGDATGTIDLTVTGGTAPYSYVWNDGNTEKYRENLVADTYTVMVTDVNGCNDSAIITISEPASALTVTEDVVHLDCYNANNGSIELSVTGGTAPYTYDWGGGISLAKRYNLPAGNYEVRIEDANGCAITKQYTITQPQELQLSAISNNISCNGAADGNIDITVTGGTAPYTYDWGGGISLDDRSGLSGGTYAVEVTDANGCKVSQTFTLSEPDALVLSYTHTDVSCFGESSGSIELTVSGGTAPYTFNWGGGVSTKDRFNLPSGNYTVLVMDAKGCKESLSVNITQPLAALSVTESIDNLSCNEANDGSVELSVTGGTAPYNFKWNNGSTAKDQYNLKAGTYEVTITDAQGCSVVQTYTVASPDPLTSTSVVRQISCFGSADGQINISVVGGTSPYTYSWSNGETTKDLQNLDVGNYKLTITDANGCNISESFQITQPLELKINYTAVDVTCFGADDGKIVTQISGGTAPYTYQWSNGALSENLSGLAGGTYSLTITDANGCITKADIVIDAPSAALLATETIENVTCYGESNGSIRLNVTGGTAPYTYLWSNGSRQRDLTNMYAGDYRVTITDAKGCQFTALYTVEQPELLDLDYTVSQASCFGDADGEIQVTPKGGTVPYSYVWSNGATSKDLADVSAGVYNLTITDANNCSITTSIEVNDSGNLNVAVQKTDVLCKGDASGAIVLAVTGGSGSYTYMWDNGSDKPVLENVPAGVYNVSISDAKGCTTTATVVISEPTKALAVEVDHTLSFACYGEDSGFAKAKPSGGTAPYTYLWSTGARTPEIENLKAGSYTVSITDANGCLVQHTFEITQPEKPVSINAIGVLQLACAGANNGSIEIEAEGGTAPYTYLWSTGSVSNKITDLRAGEYTVRVVDAKGCVTERLFSIEEPEPLVIANAEVNESQCFDDRNGSIDLDVRGGTFPYTYQWSNGATTKNLIGISSGTYSVQITDAQGCQVEATYTLATPERFVSDPFVSEISCRGANDASISLNIEGGVKPLSIQWNTGASSEVITDLEPGQYNVLITDAKGCTIQQTFNIIEPLPLMLDAYIEDAIRCNDPESGRINVIVTGGREPYKYRWSNGATTSEITNVLPGTYVVIVTDKYGCEVQGTYSVDQPEPLRIGLSSERVIDCENRMAGIKVKASVTGGFGDYEYQWSRGSSVNNEIFLTEPGRLNLVVLDDHGCLQSKAIDIDIPDIGTADYSYNSQSIRDFGEPAANEPINFYDESLGKIIDWSWDFGDGFDSKEIDPIHTFDAPGVYNVTLIATDESGCTTSKIQVIEITEGYRIMVPNAFSPNNDGKNDFFRPEFLGLTTVQFSIFNTWGEVVFSTQDKDTKGWDGMVNGIPAENGNYVYKISGLTQNGLTVSRDGVFALIK